MDPIQSVKKLFFLGMNWMNKLMNEFDDLTDNFDTPTNQALSTCNSQSHALTYRVSLFKFLPHPNQKISLRSQKTMKQNQQKNPSKYFKSLFFRSKIYI
jgi:hypothetical protein